MAEGDVFNDVRDWEEKNTMEAKFIEARRAASWEGEAVRLR